MSEMEYPTGYFFSFMVDPSSGVKDLMCRANVIIANVHTEDPFLGGTVCTSALCDGELLVALFEYACT